MSLNSNNSVVLQPFQSCRVVPDRRKVIPPYRNTNSEKHFACSALTFGIPAAQDYFPGPTLVIPGAGNDIPEPSLYIFLSANALHAAGNSIRGAFNVFPAPTSGIRGPGNSNFSSRIAIFWSMIHFSGNGSNISGIEWPLLSREGYLRRGFRSRWAVCGYCRCGDRNAAASDDAAALGLKSRCSSAGHDTTILATSDHAPLPAAVLNLALTWYLFTGSNPFTSNLQVK